MTGIQIALSAAALASLALAPVPTALSTVLLNMCLIGPSAASELGGHEGWVSSGHVVKGCKKGYAE